MIYLPVVDVDSLNLLFGMKTLVAFLTSVTSDEITEDINDLNTRNT